jgi:hypothetical protein
MTTTPVLARPSPVANDTRQIVESMHLAAKSPEWRHDRVVYGVTRIVENWHNDVHDGGFRVCDQQPCHAIRWAFEGRV